MWHGSYESLPGWLCAAEHSIDSIPEAATQQTASGPPRLFGLSDQAVSLRPIESTRYGLADPAYVQKCEILLMPHRPYLPPLVSIPPNNVLKPCSSALLLGAATFGSQTTERSPCNLEQARAALVLPRTERQNGEHHLSEGCNHGDGNDTARHSQKCACCACTLCLYRRGRRGKNHHGAKAAQAVGSFQALRHNGKASWAAITSARGQLQGKQGQASLQAGACMARASARSAEVDAPGQPGGSRAL